MNAYQLPTPPEKPTRSRRARAQANQQARQQVRQEVRQEVRQQRQQHHHRSLAVEASIKIGVNVALSMVALAALTQLIPHSLSQHSKVTEIQDEVHTVNGRVDRLKTDFSRYFDPRQARKVMQEQTNRIDPNRKVIVWSSEPDSGAAAQLP